MPFIHPVTLALSVYFVHGVPVKRLACHSKKFRNIPHLADIMFSE